MELPPLVWSGDEAACEQDPFVLAELWETPELLQNRGDSFFFHCADASEWAWVASSRNWGVRHKPRIPKLSGESRTSRKGFNGVLQGRTRLPLPLQLAPTTSG